MILVDTSVWIEHFRRADAMLAALLEAGEMLGHPFIAGERALRSLPQPTTASHAEVMRFIDREALFGRGVGYVEAHLLAAARLTPGSRLWTRDRRLQAVAVQLGLGSAPSQ